MKKNVLTDEELEELDGFLKTEFDLKIHNELTGDDYYKCDDAYALDFFRLLYSQIDFIRENKHKPLFVFRTLKKEVSDEWELYYLCRKITDYFSETNIKDEQIKVCCLKIREIADENDEQIHSKFYEREKVKKNKIRKDILAEIESLPDIQSQLKYLKLQLIEYERNNDKLSQMGDLIDENSRYSQLIKEIKKAEALVEIENKHQRKTEKQNLLDEKSDYSLTKRQWAIVMRFFINHFQLRNIDTLNFARLLAVLNKGKNLQDFRTMLGNEKGLITEIAWSKILKLSFSSSILISFKLESSKDIWLILPGEPLLPINVFSLSYLMSSFPSGKTPKIVRFLPNSISFGFPISVFV